MKHIIKKIGVTIAAAAMLAIAPISASAATEEDVVAAARGAGFLEEYVQMLQNYLNVTKFTPEQYDIMVSKLYSAGEEMDKVAIMYTGKTIAQLKGLDGSGDDSGSEDSDDNDTVDKDDKKNSKNSTGSKTTGKNNDPKVQKELEKVAQHLDSKNITNILSEMSDAAKQLGLDFSFEKRGDKNYIVTVKDKDGNVQLVTPVGKLVDTTGAQNSDDEASPVLVFGVCGGAIAAGCLGAYLIASKAKKKED